MIGQNQVVWLENRLLIIIPLQDSVQMNGTNGISIFSMKTIKSSIKISSKMAGYSYVEITYPSIGYLFLLEKEKLFCHTIEHILID